ncbi:MAG: chemotaxis protein CheW [Microcoleaceae cyanobacterium]
MSTIQADPLFAGQTNQTHQETLLSFFLSLDFQMVLPTHKLSEVIKLKTDVIAAISGMPAAVVGVCSLQDEVVWLVDLPYLLGLGVSLKPNLTTDCNLLRVKTQQGNLGILVRQVGRILSSDSDQLQFQADQTEWIAKITQAGGINPKRVKRLEYLVKELWINPEGKALPVLEVDAMVQYLNRRAAQGIKKIS